MSDAEMCLREREPESVYLDRLFHGMLTSLQVREFVWTAAFLEFLSAIRQSESRHTYMCGQAVLQEMETTLQTAERVALVSLSLSLCCLCVCHSFSVSPNGKEWLWSMLSLCIYASLSLLSLSLAVFLSPLSLSL